MASTNMTASFLGGAALSGCSPITACRRLVVAKAAGVAKEQKAKVNHDTKKEGTNGRRDMIFAAAAAALCSAAGIALADEPRSGTAEARKAYAPVCVTLPTAKICRR